MLSWVYLVCAGLLEMGWPVGLKMAQERGRMLPGILMAVVFMIASGALLFLAQRQIPMGTPMRSGPASGPRAPSSSA